jgi:hypothetical protein
MTYVIIKQVWSTPSGAEEGQQFGADILVDDKPNRAEAELHAQNLANEFHHHGINSEEGYWWGRHEEGHVVHRFYAFPATAPNSRTPNSTPRIAALRGPKTSNSVLAGLDADDAFNPNPMFTNRREVHLWLSDKPHDWPVVIAARSALRAVPLLAAELRDSPSNIEDVGRKLVLPVFRACAAAWVGAAYPTATVGCDFVTQAPQSAGRVGAAGNNPARAAAAAALSIAANAAERAAHAVDYTAGAVNAYAEGRERDIWEVTANDARILQHGIRPQDVALHPLWPGGLPPWTNFAWERLWQALILENDDWEVWFKWYEARINGGPANEALELSRAEIDDKTWEQGPRAINAEIRSLIEEPEVFRSAFDDEPDADHAGGPAVPAVPDQSFAPVRVEERGGKITRVSDRDSPLLSDEADFNAWREPVIDHVRELLSGDFRQGTNHGRARDRLVTLDTLLSGEASDVKERQFRLGYEIERLGGLVAAYRSLGDDMPALNAAVLEDLDRLRLALILGIDKLERWAEFHRLAANDPRRDGEANPTVVSEALDDMAAAMEQQATYFDPELPASFRFLAEAVRDPMGANKTVIYGSVRSAENLISFLAQRALGIASKAADAVEKHISRAVATSLIFGLTTAAIQISGALPRGWAWLKPLLDALGGAR